MRPPGQIGYETYVKAYAGGAGEEPAPPEGSAWEDLPDRLKDAWNAVAEMYLSQAPPTGIVSTSHRQLEDV